jgi:hypothetical protein
MQLTKLKIKCNRPLRLNSCAYYARHAPSICDRCRNAAPLGLSSLLRPRASGAVRWSARLTHIRVTGLIILTRKAKL